MPLRVIFLGNSDSEFSNRHFRALLETGCEVTGVVDAPVSQRKSTNPSRDEISFAELARRKGLPLFAPARPNQPEFSAEIAALRPDLLLAVGYTQILKDPLLSLPGLLPANFHASLLPAYRGMHPVFWCLRNGERWSGLTVHVMDRGIDTGDILYQVRVRTRADDSVASLYARIMEHSLPLVGRLVEDLSASRLPRSLQPETGASYYSALHEEDFRLDWGWEATKIARWIGISPGKCFMDVFPAGVPQARAASMESPSPTAAAGGGATAGAKTPVERPRFRLFFLDARLSSVAPRLSPGSIQSLGKRGALIATGKGSLRLERVCLDGQTLGFADACQVLGLQAGANLGDPAGWFDGRARRINPRAGPS